MDTQTVFGLKACLALYEARAHDIQRIYHSPAAAPLLGQMLSWAASRRIVYRQLDEEGLRKVAKSPHHEGLVLATTPLRYETPEAALADAPPPAHWLALDNVENPHNLGAILRSCAFFGLEAVLAGGPEPESKVNGAALRVAEGGAEHVRLCAAQDLPPALALLASHGHRVIGLETDAPPLKGAEFARGPWVLVAGHERGGLSQPTRAACHAVRAIPGAGRVDALNVSVAVAVALAELLRKQ